MAPTIETLFPLLNNIIKELDQLAEQASSYSSSLGETLPKKIHEKLIEIKPKVQELIIRIEKLDSKTADIVSREYEQLLQLTTQSRPKIFLGNDLATVMTPDDEPLAIHFRSYAEGLSRIREVFNKEFLENVKQARTQSDLASTKQIATPAKIININKFQGVMGDVHQPENLQIGNHAGIHKHSESEENQRGTLEPKPPEFLQKLLWLWKHGKKHRILILFAAILLLFYILVQLVF